MTMDSTGNFLFVATAPTGAILTVNGTDTTADLPSPGVAVYAIASGSLTQVAGSPFALPVQQPGQAPSPSALAVTPTVFPAQFAPWSGTPAPSAEYLYVADSIDNVVVNFSVSSSGVLAQTPTAFTPTGTLPSGVIVDPCNRFAYVANATTNNVTAYTICSVVSQTCLQADYSLHEVTGSPYPVGDLPGPMAVDPFGKALYVVNTGSSTISLFGIGSSTGSLAPLSPSTAATNLGPNSIAIRSDGTWLFVANIGSANISQYAITPATGNLTLQTAIPTLNYPSGVAVK
jgi:DNA-binding beta-propeller fold protein YncE